MRDYQLNGIKHMFFLVVQKYYSIHQIRFVASTFFLLTECSHVVIILEHLFIIFLIQSFHLKAPDGGCVAVVLRTGFETSQGKLMRTILFSTERVKLFHVSSWFINVIWITLFIISFKILLLNVI